MIKQLLLAASLLTVGNFANADAFDIDPTINGSFELTCKDPTTRTDDSVLAVGDIAVRTFYVQQAGKWVEVGSNTTACKQIFDATKLNDGLYVYSATATDVSGRKSAVGSETGLLLGLWAVTVKRLPSPQAPSNPTHRKLP